MAGTSWLNASQAELDTIREELELKLCKNIFLHSFGNHDESG